MKWIRTILCLAGSLIIRSTLGQKTAEETSWEKFSLQFESIDQIEVISDGK